MQRFSMHRSLLLEKQTIFTRLYQLNSILLRRRPIESMSECLADDSSEQIMCSAYAAVNIPQQGYSFILGDTFH